MNPPLPPHLYKYEAFNAQSLQNLKAQILFFGSPRRFNDPYDCALFPVIEQLTDPQVEQIRVHNLQSETVPPEVKLSWNERSIQSLRTACIEAATDVLKNNRDDFLNNRGVTCFSEDPDNLLMWAHYADKSQGFCLEFNTTLPPFDNEKLMRVNYSENIPSVNILDWMKWTPWLGQGIG